MSIASIKKERARLIKLLKQEAKKNAAIARNIAKLQRASETEEKGLRRLIMPEHNRPFIQKLSAAAGKIARADLKNMA